MAHIRAAKVNFGRFGRGALVPHIRAAKVNFGRFGAALVVHFDQHPLSLAFLRTRRTQMAKDRQTGQKPKLSEAKKKQSGRSLAI